MDKKEQFKQEVEKFKNSEQTAQDYLDFMIVSRLVLAQDSGLFWTDIEDTLKEVVSK